METALDLQQALYRHQKKQIDALIGRPSAAFQAYERRYHRATATFRRPLTDAQVHRRVQRSDVIYVGDYHTLSRAQLGYLSVVAAALQTGRRVVLALEFVDRMHQPDVEAFVAGKLSEQRFLKRIGHPYTGPFDIWPNFKPIFELARARGLSVHAIDSRGRGPASLSQRDVRAAEVVAALAAAEDRPLVVVLMGQFHIAPGHLPAEVTRRLGATPRRSLIVYQNAERVWWRAARAGLVDRCGAVELHDDAVCLLSASPVVCQRSFLDYVESEAGDAPVDDQGISATVKHLAQRIGRVAGISVEARLETLAVLTEDPAALVARLPDGAGRTKARAALLKHLRTRESAFVPAADAVWLARMSLNHAAEEAAHFVRHCAVGEAMERARPADDAFWARCVEEAFGFLGSKLINPHRRCTSMPEWSTHFHHGPAELRRTAAFVLALGPGADAAASSTSLLPLGDDALFLAVAHALGYQLGEALAAAFSTGVLATAQLHRLACDPCDDARDTWRRWWALATPSAAPRHARQKQSRSARRSR